MPRHRKGQTNQIIVVDIQGERYHVECSTCKWQSRYVDSAGLARFIANRHRQETGCTLR